MPGYPAAEIIRLTLTLKMRTGQPSFSSQPDGGETIRAMPQILRTSESLKWRGLDAMPELRVGETHVWRIRLPLPAGLMDRLENVLNFTERARRASFRFPADAARFAVGRAMTRICLASYCGISMAEVRLITCGNGKPSQAKSEDSRRVEFNISHSGDWVLLVFDKSNSVGADVEECRSMDWEGVSRFCLTPEELRYCDAQADRRHESFYRLWTRKEAYLKATGQGLGGGLGNICVLPGNSGCGTDYAAIMDLPMPDRYSAAICSTGGFEKVSLYDFDPNLLHCLFRSILPGSAHDGHGFL